MTFREALNAGYRRGDLQYTIGYVSRRLDTMALPVQIAGGRRKGEPYVNVPCYHSTRFSLRQYLIPPTRTGKEARA